MGTAILLLVYGLLVEAGAVIGFVKSGSRASLLAGGIPGFLLVAAAVLLLVGFGIGGYFGFAVTLALVSLFGMRYGQTKKFMPSGLMLAVSVVVAGVLVAVLFVNEL